MTHEIGERRADFGIERTLRDSFHPDRSGAEWKDPASHLELGIIGEEYAAHYLQACGYQVIATNWRQGKYELDIIAVEAAIPEGAVAVEAANLRPQQENLIFVEVKTGSLNSEPIFHFSPAKQRDFGYAIESYLGRHQKWDHAFRGDLITMTLTPWGTISQLDHYVDAV